MEIFYKYIEFYKDNGYLVFNKKTKEIIMNKKQWEKLLDGFMGLAYSFAAVSAGVSVYDHNYYGFIRSGFAIIAMFMIAHLYSED